MELKPLKNQALKEIKNAKILKDLEGIYQKYLGKKGKITRIFDSLKKLPKKKRKEIGKEANLIKREIEKIVKEKIKRIKEEFHKLKLEKEKHLDVTRPGIKKESGHLHPLTLVSRELCDIFESIGFSVVEGPEVESPWYHFDALNIKKDHPARDPWQTFDLKKDNEKLLLRAHTSPVQIRFMEKHFPPFRIIVPGKVFRPEATDATHEMQFYHLEGLMVGKDVSASNFKAIIEEALNRFFRKKTEIRLRPSFFPFTEPSFEIDLKWKKGQWLEIMGAGMVHPNVLKNSGINPKEWQGFAFGLSIDRLTMMKYKINDIRLFHGNDLRFLKQF